MVHQRHFYEEEGCIGNIIDSFSLRIILEDVLHNELERGESRHFYLLVWVVWVNLVAIITCLLGIYTACVEEP